MDMTEFQDEHSVKQVLEVLRELRVHRLDSGARFPPRSPRKAEELLGETGKLGQSFAVDTKVYTDTKTDGSGDLTSEAIEKSIVGSLQHLQMEKVGLCLIFSYHRQILFNSQNLGKCPSHPQVGPVDAP